MAMWTWRLHEQRDPELASVDRTSPVNKVYGKQDLVSFQNGT
jgi:hypothetical protein